MASAGSFRIPVAICAAVGDVLARRGSHAQLDELFVRAGAPGDPPNFAHHTKWKVWLLAATEDPDTDALAVLGRVLEEYMEVPPPDELTLTGDTLREIWEAEKASLIELLSEQGLQYAAGGRVFTSSAGLNEPSFVEAIRSGELSAVEIEFGRAIENVDRDAGVAVTAGCSLLEALFRSYLEEKEIPLPREQSLKPMWKLVRDDLGFDLQHYPEWTHPCS